MLGDQITTVRGEMMEKQVLLQDSVKNDQGQVVARMRVILNGDGSTPNVMTMGDGTPIGFNDDGSPIYPDADNATLKNAQQAMMAQAIKEQKALTKENGGDPSKVNVIDAEKNTTPKPTAQQQVQAMMMKRIATLQAQVDQLTKEAKDNGTK